MGCEDIARIDSAPARPSSLRDQFGNPTGFLGRLVGHLMAFKNGKRSEHVLSLLDLVPHHHVLEIGFGAGADVERLSHRVARVSGVDHSSEMVRMARARNARAVELGFVDLREGSACALPFAERTFDRVFSINSVQFWDDLHVGLCEHARVLSGRGLALVAIQPRNRGATADTSRMWSERIAQAMHDLGFRDVHASLSDDPIPIACVRARRAS